MIDPKFFDDLSKKFIDTLPDSIKDNVKEMRYEFEKNLKAMMQAGFATLNLVTRDEFDIQVSVLHKMRERLEHLEHKLIALETEVFEKEQKHSSDKKSSKKDKQKQEE